MSAIVVRNEKTPVKSAVDLSLTNVPATKAVAETMMEFTDFAKSFSATVSLIKT